MHDWEARLRGARLRVTQPRLAVLRAVESHPHADVETIATEVRRSLPSVSTQAVYDCLRVFTETAQVRRIEPAGSPGRYEARTGDNHHHVVCRRCGTIEDVDCVSGSRPCLEAGDRKGYLVEEAEVTFWGLCPGCRLALARPVHSARSTSHVRENGRGAVAEPRSDPSEDR